jgi:hypothetical protein
MRFRVWDSDTEEEYPEHDIAAVSYTPSWQLLRARCSFKSLETARVAVALLLMYTDRSPDEEERQWRVWRVANLLRAVPRGNPTAIGIHCVDPAVGHFLPTQTDRMLKLTAKVGKPTYWDWAITRRDAIATWQKVPTQFRDNCTRLRVYRVRGPNPKRELRHYMSICEEVMDEFMPAALFNEKESNEG